MRGDATTTAEIERELDATRSRLDATIWALQQRLVPKAMVGEAVNYLKERDGVEITRNIGRSIRDNPVPVALIGVGLGWLALNGSRWARQDDEPWQDRPWMGEGRFRGDPEHDFYERGNGGDFARRQHERIRQPLPYEAAARDDLTVRAEEAGAALKREAEETESAFQDRIQDARAAVLGLTRRAGEAAESFARRVEEAMHATAHRVGEAMHGAADMAGDLAGRGRSAARDFYDYGASAASGARDMGGRTVDYVQERPLLLGALGVTVGAVIGMLIPASRYERRVAGSLRQRIGDAAGEVAADARDRAMNVADSMLDAAGDAVRREGRAGANGNGGHHGMRGRRGGERYARA